MRERPARVPKAARFSRHGGWWQVGDVKKGRPFGPWRTFRDDGSPLFEARFDAKGRLQGTYTRFHSDGSLARRAIYAKGAPVGEHVYYRGDGDLFPCSDPRVHQVVIRHDGDGKIASRTLLDEHGHEVGEVAAAEVAGMLDALFTTLKPDGFLATGALAAVVDLAGKAPPLPVDELLLPVEMPARRPLASPTDVDRRFAEIYGKPMPAALRAWFDAMARDPDLVGVRAITDGDLAGDGNLAEALIAEYQAAPGRAEALRELVAGTFAIAATADGVTRYALSLCETGNNQPTDAIYALTASTHVIDRPDARSLDDFAYAVALATAAERGAVSPGCLTAAWARLRGRIELRAPLAAIHARAVGEDDDGETAGDESGDHREGFYFRRATQIPLYFFHRAQWLFQLLCGHAESAAASFDVKLEGGLDDERFAKIRAFAPKEPWVACYWLFRCLAFDDPRLDALVRACGDTPSKLVRDLATLVGELAAGRKQLGAIADFTAVRRRFAALDPLANRSDEAEDEAPEATAVPDELAPAAAVLDWARNQGYERENLSIDDELDCAALGLALRADPAIVPHLVAVVDDTPWLGARLLAPWLDGDRAVVADLVPQARAWLADHGTGAVHKWRVAAPIVARGGTADDAALIASVLDPMLDSFFTRDQGFDAAMGMMTLREALRPLCESLAKLGVPASFVPTLEGVVNAESHLVDEARGPCALALAAARTGLDAIVAGVRRQLAQGHGHRITPGQLLAIGALGRGPELTALVESIADLDHEAKVAQACALADLGAAVDVEAAVRAGLAGQRYSDSDTAKQRAFVLDLVGTRRDVPAELARPWVHDADLEVHRAAVRALAARGVAIPAFTLYDPLHVAQLSREEIHVGLDDPDGLYRSNLALWLSDHPDPSSREPLARAVRRLAAEPGFPDDGPRHYELRWAVRALIAIGGAEDVLDELLRHDNEAFADPVLRYAERISPGVALGMAQVFATRKNWMHATAKAYLARHRHDPAIAAALADYGLALEDISRHEEE